MAVDESYWINEAQSWQAKYRALEESLKPAIERVKEFKTNFGVKEKSDGSIEIDWEKFVDRLGLENALVLRGEIDQRWAVSGNPGEKPKVRVKAA